MEKLWKIIVGKEGATCTGKSLEIIETGFLQARFSRFSLEVHQNSCVDVCSRITGLSQTIPYDGDKDTGC